MKKKRVLFVCNLNGARSRIAEALINRKAPGKIEAQAASFGSEEIGALPIDVMREAGMDLPAEAPKSVFELYREKKVYDYVISLCHEATTVQCPIFLTSVDTLYGKEAERISWSIQDFKSLRGSAEERKAGAREIIDKIESEVISFLEKISIETENVQ